MTPIKEIAAGLRVQLRKAHACGGDEWTVTRAGADVGMVCARCGRRVMLEREEFERRIKRIVALPDAPASRETLSE
jgi:hypothetical protein